MSVENHTAPVEYRPIPGRPEYRVGSDGSVQSCIILGGPNPRIGTEWRDLKTVTRRRGYKVVSIPRLGPSVAWPVHHLVLWAFVGPKPEGMECRHKDGNPANNALSNLAWGTHQENEDDKKRHGTRPKGARHPHAKLTEDDVRQIREEAASGRFTKIEIARRRGLHHSTVLGILSGKGWAHV